jgi:hypothetical protein
MNSGVLTMPICIVLLLYQLCHRYIRITPQLMIGFHLALKVDIHSNFTSTSMVVVTTETMHHVTAFQTVSIRFLYLMTYFIIREYAEVHSQPPRISKTEISG